MAKKKVPDERETRRERVQWVLDNLFGGRQRRMAEAVGVSQAAISHVVCDRQGAGDRLLEAIGSLVQVNPNWILRGEGEPLLELRTGSLPLGTHILPGPPTDYRHLLTEGYYPVAEDHHRESRYWLRLMATDPILRDRRLHMREGDLLLVETDPEWLVREDLVLDKLCAISIANRGSQRCELDILRRNGRQPIPERMREQPGSRPTRSTPRLQSRIGERHRNIILGTSVEPSQKQSNKPDVDDDDSSPKVSGTTHPVEGTDDASKPSWSIVGVAILVSRSLSAIPE